MKCRYCHSHLEHVVLDLGFSPPSNAFLRPEDLGRPEAYYPLRIGVCEDCWLVQTEDFSRANELFGANYAYFSSISSSWLEHAAKFFRQMSRQLGLGKDSLVIEVGSNDGYLLRNFLAAGINCLGIEPTDSTASSAERLGIPVLREFFGEQLGRRLAAQDKRADLLVGNNVYAHVPDIRDFTRGLKAALKPGGTVSLEFPHLMRLLEYVQFDTVYHEHYSYLSLFTVIRMFADAGLRVWNVEELPTHGGSLRIYGCHDEDGRRSSSKVYEVLKEEEGRGMRSLGAYSDFQMKANRIKDEALLFLLRQKQAGKKVAGYGAAAKGNTLINYAGIKPDLLPFICDASPSKQGRLTPGGHIPIYAPEILVQQRPDYLWVLPWNIIDEVKRQNAHLANLGTKFVTAVPRLEIQ